MINWTTYPDPVFYDIVRNSLEYFQDSVTEEHFDDTYHLFDIFGQNGLAIEIEKLIKAHKSIKTYIVTDYHFLILYEALTKYCEIYNDGIFEETSLGGIHPSLLSLDEMADIYFWDTDFLFDQNTINNLSVAQKDEMSISSDIFSIANNLTPHSDELKFTVTDDLESDHEILFKDGKPYPYYDDIDV